MATHRTWLFDKPCVSPADGLSKRRTCRPLRSPPTLSRAPSPIPTCTSTHHTQTRVLPPTTSTGLTFLPRNPRPILSPLVSFATYAALAVAALTGLFALLLTGYGLSAFDDARRRLTDVRVLVGKGLGAGWELVHGAKEVVEGVVSAHQPSRSSHQEASFSPGERTPDAPPHEHIPRPLYPLWQARAQPSSTGYTVPSPTDTDDCDARDVCEDEFDAPPHCPTSEPGPLPPRPPLPVLVGSLLLTLVIVAGRLVVLWWMGQQAPKNTSRAFRHGRQAFEAAARRGYQTRSSRW